MKTKVVNASVEDVSEIVAINNSFLEYSAEHGILLTPTDIDDYRSRILTNPGQIKVVKTENNEVAGFIECAPSVEEEVMNRIRWIDELYQRRFLKQMKMYIVKVAVRRDLQRKGIGRQLYETLIHQYPDHLLYAFIAERPFNNEVSMKFHTDLGFVRAANFKSNNFLGLSDYKSALVIRW